MLRWARLPLLLLPLAVLLTVLVDTPFHKLGRSALSGVLEAKPRPPFTWTEFWRGTFQTKFEAWLEQELALKPAMVRTDNTLNLLAFWDISAHTQIPVVLGRRGTLFEMNYIDNQNGVSEFKSYPPPKSPDSVAASVRKVGRAARAFRRLGIDFMVVFYPSKGWIWRDRVPTRYKLAGGRTKAATGYTALLGGLRAEGVSVIDGVAAFEELAQKEPELPLFATGGTHWTLPAACTVAQLVVGELSFARGRHLKCQVGSPRPPNSIDTDIADLINVWDNSRFVQPIPWVRASLSRPLPAPPPNALVIGTSFSDHLRKLLIQGHVFRDVKTFRYYRHKDVDSTNWARQVAVRQAVIIEQWQWSYLTINATEFLDDLEARAPVFAEALHEVDAAAASAP